ncbi:hypothetical protein Tdes44962_MAKER00705 [Teratosphaeria destructans]|uniref:Uncharacterized protein n=1 Tax=Teratosphaeria destructans TaxID=418781 RepID=A0A9W7VZU7_9PEZI|nr:hypothetical protein Tdes44962_MAKER00705 [Teratosphaeria destructans]
MCNGQSSRTSQGGTIAILKPIPRVEWTPLKRDLALRIAEDASTGRTNASIDGLGAFRSRDARVVIHRDGDLRASPHRPESEVLSQFALPSYVADGASWALTAKLDLGVGGDGIIGRRVSLVLDDDVWGEGVIGYN